MSLPLDPGLMRFSVVSKDILYPFRSRHSTAPISPFSGKIVYIQHNSLQICKSQFKKESKQMGSGPVLGSWQDVTNDKPLKPARQMTLVYGTMVTPRPQTTIYASLKLFNWCTALFIRSYWCSLQLFCLY